MGHFTFNDLYNSLHSNYQLKQPSFQLNFTKEQDIEDEVDELDEIINLQKQTAQIIDEVLPQIKQQLDKCNKIRAAYCQWNLQVMDHRVDLLQINKTAVDQDAVLLGELNGLNVQLQDLQSEYDEYNKELADKVNEVNSKVDKVEKWCWVPFYNLELLSEYNNSFKVYKDKLEKTGKAIRYKMDDIDVVRDEILQKTDDSKNTMQLVALLDHENRIYTDRINQLSKIVAQWNQFYNFYVKLKSDLGSLDDIKTVLASSDEQLKAAREAEDSIDYQSFSQQNLFMGSYGFARPKMPEYQFYYRVLTLSNGKNIIMEKSNDLFTVNNSQITFEPVDFNNGNINPNQTFDIVKCDADDNTYELINEGGGYRRTYIINPASNSEESTSW